MTDAPPKIPPKIADLLQQGLFHHRQGDLRSAIERYSEVLRIDPNNADALYYAAVIACQEDQLKEGLSLARRSLEQGPQARTHNLIGKALEREGDHLEAVKAFDAAIALDADYAEAHGNRAAILAEAGLAAEALKGFDRALALDPAAATDWINRGALLQKIGRHEEALASYEKALTLVPDEPTFQMNRANALASLGRYGEAERLYDAILARAPKAAIAMAHKALAMKMQGRLSEARVLLDQAHKIEPKNAAVAVPLAELMLLSGEWRPAWPLYEARATLPRPPFRPLPGERWQGQPAGDFRLVVLCEDDPGEAVLFARYASLLAGRGHAVTVLAPPLLAPLLRTLPGIERVISDPAALDDDKRRYLWTPLCSTPRLLHLTADNVPEQAPYLSADPARAKAMAERIGGDGFKVGLVWREGATGVPLSTLAPLAEVPGVRLVSLQKGPAAAEAAQAEFGARLAQPLDPNAISPEALADLAAAVSHLDLVVATDSLIAHIAGALGKPVFLALSAVPAWHWLMGRDDTPWYREMRLFRRDGGDWPAVAARMAEALRQRMG